MLHHIYTEKLIKSTFESGERLYFTLCDMKVGEGRVKFSFL